MYLQVLNKIQNFLNMLITELFFGTTEGNSKESLYFKRESLFYRRIGIWKSQTTKEVNWFKFTVIVSLLLIGIVNGSYMFYLNYNNFEINTDILLHIAVSIHSLFVFLIFIYNQKSTKWLLNILNEEFYNFEDLFNEKSNVWKVEERRTLIQTNLFYYLVFTADIVYIIQTNFYTFDLKQSKLLYPLWFPFDTRGWLYYLALVIQILIFFTHLNVHVMSCGLFGGCANFYSAMTDIISNVMRHINHLEKFRIMSSGNKRSGNVLSEKEMEELQNWLLQQCIDAHILMKKFEKEVISIYGVIILELVSVSELLICFSGYQFIQAVQDQDMQTMLKSMFLFAIMTVQLFIYCSFGQTLESNSLLFTQKLYDSEWYRCSNSFKISFLIFLINTGKPVRVSQNGIVHATLNTFLKTLKAAFSYLNLLLILSRDHS